VVSHSARIARREKQVPTPAEGTTPDKCPALNPSVLGIRSVYDSAMSRKPRPLVLSESERLQLAHIAERGDDWRARQRSRTLLMLHSGTSINAVAAEQGLDRDTVAAHRDTWLAKGVDALVDAPRSGAPRKLQPDLVQALCDWASAEALSAPQLREKLQDKFSVEVSTWVVQKSLTREGFVWKRTRHSLKKNEISPLLAVPSPRSQNSRPRPSEES